MVRAVALQQGVREGLSGLPGEAGGDGPGVDRVEVTAGRQDVDQAAQRGAGGARRDEAAA
ncbi:putative Cobaltochelatase [Streptomyces viridochromogenes Tue57]|uniref:Putative Cobaltochelatase n=1 Tax=Streptomyces viridochromogenes Tue57 TaxID=1160705 RepID=L8PMN9_STRVR|nr:putative Cobaltochelatase [Streptomyces viridochromogenes Tue57]